MYFNTKLLKEKEMNLPQLAALQLFKQNGSESEDVSGDIAILMKKDVENLKIFADAGLISHVKAKKNQTEFHTVRLSDKGKELLDALTTPKIEDGDIKMCEYLCEKYIEGGEDRKVGNRKKVLQYCAEFRGLTCMTHRQMYYLCILFLREYQYTKVLENIFFVRAKNIYGKFKDNLEDSKLYQFFEENEHRVREYWKEKGAIE